MAAERVVVGGSIAALVAADALGRAGCRVRLILPERGVGGGFAAMRRDGRVLELGVRLLELAYEGAPATAPPLTAYAPRADGHRPYIGLIAAWVRDLVGDRLVEAPRPAMVLDGRRVDDLLFTVDLASAPETFADDERATMLRELDATAWRTVPAGVLARSPDELDRLTLEEASVANHGRAFHDRVIAPLCDKVLPGGARRVLPSLRRKVWAPLFHPRTLRRALAGDDPGFRPRRTFHTVAPDGCGGLVDRLVERVEAGVAVERRGALTGIAAGHRSETRLAFADGSTVTACRPVVGVPPAELFAAAGIPLELERVRTAIAWFEQRAADAEAPGTVVHVLDPGNPVVRASVGGAGRRGRRLLCAELRHDVAAEDLAGAARRGLVQAGLARDGARLCDVMSAARPTFAAPTSANADAFEAARRRLARRALDVEIVGGALAFGADAVNEQIVQGLRAGAIAT